MPITKVNSLGVSLTSPVTFPAGTVSLPSITTSGDTNTGVFFPSADTMAFTEGGAEAMRIDSSGEVGINTTNPLHPLHVQGTVHLGVSGTSSGNVTGTLSIGNTGTFYMTQIRAINTQSTPSVLNTRMGFFTLSGTAETAADATEKMTILAGSGNVGINETNPTSLLRVNGSLSKASGSFQIDHPLENKKDTHYLVHSFVESPQANNIYRGKINLINGTATVNLDTVSGMTENTFVALNRDIHCFTSNESGWTPVKGSVSDNILTITAQDNNCNDTISWLVIGERQDKHMYETEWTDENGKVIVEPLKIPSIQTLESK
jgi:hypothetical protein